MDPRILTAALAITVFVLATMCTFIYLRVERVDHGAHGLAARLLLWSLWTMALLGIYSATSFIWAGDIDHGILEALRYLRLALTTVVGIMLGGVLAFWLRIIRRS